MEHSRSIRKPLSDFLAENEECYMDYLLFIKEFPLELRRLIPSRIQNKAFINLNSLRISLNA